MTASRACESINTGLDLFAVPPVQTSVQGGLWTEYHPIATIGETGPIEFVIKGAGDDYIDLANSFIHVQAKVLRSDGTALKDSDDMLVAPENLFIQTMFSEIDVNVNGTLITASTGTYGYRAYLESILTYGKDYKQTQLGNSMYYEGDGNQFSISSNNTDKGLQKRRERIKRSKLIDMTGRLHIDIFSQERFLVNNVDLRLRFVRAKNNFALLASAPMQGDNIEAYKIKIEHMSLYIRKVTLNPAVVLGHARALQEAPAKYPIRRSVPKVFSCSAGLMNVVQDNLFLNQRPNRLVVAMVESKAFNGDYTKSAFEFKHFHTKSMALYIDGHQIPSKPYTPDFEKKRWARSYLSLFTGTGMAWKDIGNTISYDEYDKGFAIWCFDLSPSMADGDQVELLKTGNLRIEISFSKPLPDPIHVIVLGELDGMIEIDKSRRVLTDFTS